MKHTALTMTMNKPRYDKTLFKALGQAVSSRRLQLLMSQDELGDKSGLDANYIKDIEGGLRNLNLGTLAKVCRALGYSISELFTHVEVLMVGTEDAVGGSAAKTISQNSEGG